jgi:hypothetical protein
MFAARVSYAAGMRWLVAALCVPVAASAQPACEPADVALHKAAELEAGNRKRLDAALERRGLHAIKLESRVRAVEDRERFQDGDVHRGEIQFLVSVPCDSRADAGFAFVADEHGNVFRLHEGRRTTSSPQIVSCGCPRYAAGCGTGPRREVVLFALPARSAYKEDVHVEYDYDAAHFVYAGQGCPGPAKVP